MNILNQATDLVTPTTTSGPSDDFDTLIDSIDEHIGKSANYYTLIKTELDNITKPLDNIKIWLSSQKGKLAQDNSKIQKLEQDIEELTNKLNAAEESDSTGKNEIINIKKQLEDCNKAKTLIETEKNALSEKVTKVTTFMKKWSEQLEKNAGIQFTEEEVKGMFQTIIAMNEHISSLPPSLPPPPPSSVDNSISVVPISGNDDKSSSDVSSSTFNPMQKGQGKKRKHIKTRRKTHSRTRSKSSKSKKLKKSNKTKKLKKLKHKNSRKRSRK